MRRDDLADLQAFLAVAEERNFTRAAARLGMSQPALSQTINRLEERLGIRLLSRTTRNVATTEAGRIVLGTLQPALNNISSCLDGLNDLRQSPTGTVRLTASRHGAHTVLRPAVDRILARHPEIKVEVLVEQRMIDIVEAQLDAGIRLGDRVDRDMIAVRIGPDLRMAVVSSPDYFARRGRPATPEDLYDHDCINLRLTTHGGLNQWHFTLAGRQFNVRVDGRFISNDPDLITMSAISGNGIAFMPENFVQEHIDSGRLERVLEDYCYPVPGYHIYYPSSRQPTAAFRAVLDELRY